jgi:putative acetyltransferase
VIVARAERADDVGAVRAVECASFPTSAEADLVDLLRDAGHLTVSLVAELDGDIVGHVAFSPVSVGSGRVGVGLAPVAVCGSHRRRGVGAQLIEAGLVACEALGFGWAVVLGDPAYYSRFGFRPASALGLFGEFGGGDAFQVIELTAGTLPWGGGLVSYSGEFGSLRSSSG